MLTQKAIKTAHILCVGTELLLGDIVNTNAAFLSQRLADLGICVYKHTVVGDNPARLKAALAEALADADLVITSGGLGPTYDDLTKETVADAFGLEMELDERSLATIKAYFERTGRRMPPNNEKQAMMPRGARVFDNHYGTAPALAYNGLLQGNLGSSITYGKPVAEIIKEPLLNTIFLNLLATALALSITIPLGIFCAKKQGSKRDFAVQVGTIVGYSVPTFIIAILFIWFFAIQLNLFPVSGMSSVGKEYTGFRAVLDRLYHFALPLLVMTFCSLGGMTRYVRASMLDALRLDCIRTARAKGLNERLVVRSHAFRNALIPIIALLVGWLLSIFSGSIMIENVFGINGIGRVYFEALTTGDNEIALAMQMFYILIALLGNLLVDIAYGVADPRIRLS